MQAFKTIPVAELEIGKAYNVVRSVNAAGQPMLNIRRGDWRAVLMTAENLARYADGTYLVEAIKDKHTPRLLAAGWTRLSYSRGECGLEISTPGPLFGLACGKSAFWSKGGARAMCAQHAITYL